MRRLGRNHKKCYVLFTVLLIFELLINAYSYTYVLASTLEGAGESGVRVMLTEEEKQYIREHSNVTIAMDTSWIPYCYATGDKEVVGGILPDFYKKIAENVGLNISFLKEQSYMDAITAVNSGQAMLVSGIANDENMAERNQVNITNPYIQIYYSAVTKKSTDNLYKMGKNYKVAVCKGSYATIAMKEKMPSYEFVDYSSNEECMNAVLEDEVDLALVATHSVDYYVEKHVYSKLHTVMIDDFTWGLCVGVNQNCDPILIDILNKGIAAMTDNERSQAVTTGLLSATTDNTSLDDMIYSQPKLAMGLAVLIATMLLVITLLMILRMRSRTQNRKLEEALSAAEEANRFKTEFLSRVSHDMRTPLNGILGLTYLSRSETEVEVLKKNFDKVGETGEYLLGLINDTLDFQKIESGRMTLDNQIVSAKTVIQGVLNMVQPLANNKGIEFRYENENVDLDNYVRLDSIRTKQIFINVLSNAVKFTPEGGTVLFQLECLGRDGIISHNRYIVKDTGIGMSEAFLQDGIFKAFSQEHSDEYANQGTGLGLSITKKLVELMGGSIRVESKRGCGTTFTIDLDIERIDKTEAKQECDKGENRNQCSMARLEGKRILLVEDHPLNADIATKLLIRAGCMVTWKENGQKGLTEFMESECKYYDLILMDIRMPVLDGLEATKKIRALDREDATTIPIIAMTANAYEKDIEDGMEIGMSAYLSKPVSPARMYETIEKFI